MKWPVWREVLGPTLLVGTLWLVVSTSTTVFMSWKDAAYQELLSDNLTVAESMQALQTSLSGAVLLRGRTQEPAADEPNRKLSELAGRYQQSQQALRRVADPAALRMLEELDHRFGELVTAPLPGLAPPVRGGAGETGAGSASRSTELVEQTLRQVDEGCRQVIQHNWDQARDSQAEFRYYNRVVMTVRQILNLLGPAIGVWLGYRAASRLRKQIARITVRLGETDLGRVEVAQENQEPDPADLESLDRQVGRVQERLVDVVSQLQNAQQEVLRSERLAAVGQLAAGVAHELRNPLTSVKLLIQTAYESANPSPSQPRVPLSPQTFHVLTSEIERMERTIQSLLDFARPAQPRRTRHDFREPLQRVQNLTSARAAQQRVVVTSRGDDEPLWVVGDTEQLVQVLLNLVLNGIEAMPAGGSLELELFRCWREGQRWVGLRIRDHGPGLEPAVLAHLFEPFVTTKERGTGLGLAVSRRIVLEHDGQLVVRNHPEGGAEFELWLPEAERADRVTPVENRTLVRQTVG